MHLSWYSYAGNMRIVSRQIRTLTDESTPRAKPTGEHKTSSRARALEPRSRNLFGLHWLRFWGLFRSHSGRSQLDAQLISRRRFFLRDFVLLSVERAPKCVNLCFLDMLVHDCVWLLIFDHCVCSPPAWNTTHLRSSS